MLFSGRNLFEGRSHAPYDILAHLPSGLMLDIGASNGAFSRLMLAKNPSSRVAAFEPFPGNITLLRASLGDDHRVEIVAKAVSDDRHDVPFFVSSTVQDEDSLWGAGFSALGHIVDAPTDKDRTITVKTVGIDEYIGDKHVVFAKIDVQGGEISVLRSARKALADQRIDVMHVEFSGERDLFEHIQGIGYIVFDAQYGLIPLYEDANTDHWDIVGPMKLSTGRLAHYAWPKEMPTTVPAYLDFIERERKQLGNIFTDLICVSPKALASFLPAAIEAAGR